MSSQNKDFNKNKLLEELRKISKQHEKEYQDLEKRCERDLKTLKEKISEQAEEIVDDNDKEIFSEAIEEIEGNMEKQKSNLKLKQAQQHQLILEDFNYHTAGSSSGGKYEESRNLNKNHHHKRGRSRGYRKRAGYQHKRREAWSNLIMSVWGGRFQ